MDDDDHSIELQQRQPVLFRPSIPTIKMSTTGRKVMTRANVSNSSQTLCERRGCIGCDDVRQPVKKNTRRKRKAPGDKSANAKKAVGDTTTIERKTNVSTAKRTAGNMTREAALTEYDPGEPTTAADIMLIANENMTLPIADDDRLDDMSLIDRHNTMSSSMKKKKKKKKKEESKRSPTPNVTRSYHQYRSGHRVIEGRKVSIFEYKQYNPRSRQYELNESCGIARGTNSLLKEAMARFERTYGCDNIAVRNRICASFRQFRTMCLRISNSYNEARSAKSLKILLRTARRLYLKKVSALVYALSHLRKSNVNMMEVRRAMSRGVQLYDMADTYAVMTAANIRRVVECAIDMWLKSTKKFQLELRHTLERHGISKTMHAVKSNENRAIRVSRGAYNVLRVIGDAAALNVLARAQLARVSQGQGTSTTLRPIDVSMHAIEYNALYDRDSVDAISTENFMRPCEIKRPSQREEERRAKRRAERSIGNMRRENFLSKPERGMLPYDRSDLDRLVLVGNFSPVYDGKAVCRVLNQYVFNVLCNVLRDAFTLMSQGYGGGVEHEYTCNGGVEHDHDNDDDDDDNPPRKKARVAARTTLQARDVVRASQALYPTTFALQDRTIESLHSEPLVTLRTHDCVLLGLVASYRFHESINNLLRDCIADPHGPREPRETIVVQPDTVTLLDAAG